MGDTRSRKGGTPAGTGAPSPPQRAPPAAPRHPRGPDPPAARQGPRAAGTPVSTTRCPHKAPAPLSSPRARQSQESPRRAVTPARSGRSPPKAAPPPLRPPGPSRTPQAAAAAHRRETLRVTSPRRHVRARARGRDVTAEAPAARRGRSRRHVGSVPQGGPGAAAPPALWVYPPEQRCGPGTGWEGAQWKRAGGAG